MRPIASSKLILGTYRADEPPDASRSGVPTSDTAMGEASPPPPPLRPPYPKTAEARGDIGCVGGAPPNAPLPLLAATKPEADGLAAPEASAEAGPLPGRDPHAPDPAAGGSKRRAEVQFDTSSAEGEGERGCDSGLEERRRGDPTPRAGHAHVDAEEAHVAREEGEWASGTEEQSH